LKLFYICLLIVLPSVIFAQSNYHEGYVVKNNGDTLRGYINYREWGQNPVSIDFKKNKEEKQTLQFNPQTIKGFQIIGMETYVSYTGIISMNKTRFPDLPDGQDTSKAQATIFLKQLATGSHITLFYHNDERKSRFFIAETNKNPVELKYYQYYADQQNAVEKPLYRGQLIVYINKFNSGNAGLKSKAERVSYEIATLEALVNEINGNKFEKANGVNAKNKGSAIRLFVGAGVFNTGTIYTNGNFMVRGEYGTSTYSVKTNSFSVAPLINFGFDLFVNPNVQQLIFRTALSLSYVNARLNYPKPNQYPLIDYILTFNQYTTSITPQLLYNVYNKDNFKIYIDGGVSVNLSAYTNSAFTDPTTGENDPNQRSFDYSSLWLSFPLQAGVIINKKVEISFAYTPFAKFVPHSSEFISNQSTGLGIKFFFGH
jgi:hypothetical protein